MTSWTRDLQDIRTLYLRELRSALREKMILINSLLVPLLLYPVLLWGVFTLMTFVQGQEEKFVSRVAFFDLPAAHEKLQERLLEKNGEEGAERVRLVEASGPESATEAVRAGELDLVVRALDPSGDAASLDENVSFELVYDASKDRSVAAYERFENLLSEYRTDWIEREAARLGVDQGAWELFAVERTNTATSEDMGAFFLGLLVPLLMIIMIAVGCFYPAVDATAGERERSTWETLMTVAASRRAVVTAKFLYVASLGAAAGLLNLGAMTVSMGAILQPMLGDDAGGMSFEIPLAALPLMALAALLLALFVAAGMMLFAAFARTFKEGQSMIGPFYLVCLLPPLLVNSPDLELTLGWAFVPIANVALLFRAVLVGSYPWALIGVVFAVEIVTVVLLLWAARWVLGFEDVLTGSYGGDASRFFREKILRKKILNRKPKGGGDAAAEDAR